MTSYMPIRRNYAESACTEKSVAKGLLIVGQRMNKLKVKDALTISNLDGL